LLDWGGGLIWAAYTNADIERIRSAIPAGHATLWKAPRALRESAEVFPRPPAAVAALAAKLKAAFDPHGRLNPGRMGRQVTPGHRAVERRHCCNRDSNPSSSPTPTCTKPGRCCANACTAAVARRGARPTCCSATSPTALGAGSI